MEVSVLGYGNQYERANTVKNYPSLDGSFRIGIRETRWRGENCEKLSQFRWKLPYWDTGDKVKG